MAAHTRAASSGGGGRAARELTPESSAWWLPPADGAASSSRVAYPQLPDKGSARSVTAPVVPPAPLPPLAPLPPEPNPAPPVLATASTSCEEGQIALAGTLVRAALKGRKVAFKNDADSMFWMELYYNRTYRNVLTAVAALHMALALVEPASTMNPSPAPPEPGALVADTRPIEALILLVYLADIALKMRFMGLREYFRSWNRAEVLATVCFAADLLLPLRPLGGLQFSRVLRPMFIVTKRKHIRFIFTGILHSTPRMVPVFLLLAAGVAAFALMATTALSPASPAFADVTAAMVATPPYCSVYSRGACQNFYEDFTLSFYTLFVLVARANWPLSFLPFYQRSQWVALFFCAVMLVGHFFLWRLLLAVSFASYADHCRSQYTAQQRRSRAALKAAFALVAQGTVIHPATFHRLALRAVPSAAPEVVDVIFHAVGGHLGALDALGFVAACSLLDVAPRRVHYAHTATCLDRARLRVERLLSTTAVSLLLDCGIMAVALADLVLSQYTASDGGSGASSEHVTAVVILGAFMAEAAARLFAWGPRRYWANGFNRIDLAVIVMSLGTLGYGAAVPDVTRARILLFLRLTRVFHVLDRVPPVHNVLATVSRITPLLWRIIVVLIISMYSLAIIGVEAFTGTLNPANPAVAASAYGVNAWYPFNYDTFARSMMSQFMVLVTSQSAVLLEGLMAGTASWWPAVYFLAAYILVVCIVSNILIALLLQSYGISSRNVSQRQAGYVEIWEHLLARAQGDLHDMDSRRFPHPLMWTFARRNAFMNVNEALFGEELVLQFEVEAAEVAAGAAGAGAACAGGGTAGGAAGGSGARMWSNTEAFFGGLIGGAVGGGKQQSRPKRNAGIASLRVHAAYDPVAAAADAAGQPPAAADAAAGEEEDSVLTVVRPITQFIASSLVPARADLLHLALTPGASFPPWATRRGGGDRPPHAPPPPPPPAPLPPLLPPIMASPPPTTRSRRGTGTSAAALMRSGSSLLRHGSGRRASAGHAEDAAVELIAAGSAAGTPAAADLPPLPDAIAGGHGGGRIERLRRITALAAALANEQAALRVAERDQAIAEVEEEDAAGGGGGGGGGDGGSGFGSRLAAAVMNVARHVAGRGSLHPPPVYPATATAATAATPGGDTPAALGAGTPLLDPHAGDDEAGAMHTRVRSATLLGENVHLAAGHGDAAAAIVSPGADDTLVAMRADGFVYTIDT